VNADLLQGFYLDDILVEPTTGQVKSPAGSKHLPPKAAEVLLSLASRPGELVTRETLLEEVWGAGRGTAEALSHAVSDIRQALGDHRDNPHFVQTLPRRGYRLLVTPAIAAENTSSIVLGAGEGFKPDDIGLFENLKQRGVLETGLAYLILGWLLIQVADIVFEQLLLPRWVATFVTLLVIAGFPIALLLSWFLEFRHGRAVVYEPSPDDARRQRFSRTYKSVIAALGIAAVFVFIYDKSIGLPEEAPPATRVAGHDAALPPVSDNSIAVLPFVNLDGSNDTQVFANGLVDDVITRLSRVSGLLVSARGDSHTLAPNSSSQDVRARLRVSMYLEGSVQMLGDKIRVIVQLIDSSTGFHVLSRTFDRPRADFFNIRDEITELTVANVQVVLPSNTQQPVVLATDNPSLDVYLLYRRGIDASRLPWSAETVSAALGWFDEALAIDPGYAAAYAGKCTVYVDGYFVNDDAEYIDDAETACSRALEINPNLDVVHTALGKLYEATGQYSAAETAYLEALRINPGNATSLIGLGKTYMRQQRSKDAEQILARAIGLHPGDWTAYNTLGSYYFRAGRFDEAITQYEYVVALDRSNMMGHSNLGTARMLAGDFAGAAAAMQAAIDIEPRANTYSNLGLMHYYLGDFEKAISSHRKAVELAPNDHLRLSNLGDALRVAGEPDEAMRAFVLAEHLAKSAVEVNPNDPNTRMDLAWISTMLGKQAEARSLIELARQQAPDDPYVDYIDGLMSLYNGDADGAQAAFEAAVAKGYSVVLLAAEPQLASMRHRSGFKRLLGGTKIP
jgi:TolB-like protein/tetratricopeptide (TPR) repeat protein/DNA-binding winged helix-turn-helix (wHTH) protein